MYQLFLNRLLITEVISTVHISKDFSLRNQSDVQLYAKNTLDWRKIKMVNAPLRIQQIIHPSDTPRLLLLPYLVRQICGHDGRKHTTIEKQENRQSTEDKTKKQRVGRR